MVGTRVHICRLRSSLNLNAFDIARHTTNLVDGCGAAVLGRTTSHPATFSFQLDVPLQAVDRFINGDFYRHPLTAEAILDVAQELRVREAVATYRISIDVM